MQKSVLISLDGPSLEALIFDAVDKAIRLHQTTPPPHTTADAAPILGAKQKKETIGYRDTNVVQMPEGVVIRGKSERLLFSRDALNRWVDHILSMTEIESVHRRDMEIASIKHQFRLAQLGVILGFSAICLVVVLCGYFVHEGHPTVAATIACTVLRALAYVFRIGQKSKADEDSDKPTENG